MVLENRNDDIIEEGEPPEPQRMEEAPENGIIEIDPEDGEVEVQINLDGPVGGRNVVNQPVEGGEAGAGAGEPNQIQGASAGASADAAGASADAAGASTSPAEGAVQQGNANAEADVYVSWAVEAAAATTAPNKPLDKKMIALLSKVFDNDMLLEQILEKIIIDKDTATIRTCRLVSRNWLVTLAKLYRKMKMPQFYVNTSRDTSINEARPRPLFDHHTLLYEFVRPITTNLRHEDFIPTFSLVLGPSYFRKGNYNDFVNCLELCGESLVHLSLNFPKNSGMSFLLPPHISLPNLTKLGVSFSGQSLLSHFPLTFQQHQEYFPNHCSIHLVQQILNASDNLRHFHFLPCNNPINPPDMENLYLPETLTTIHVETPLKDFELFLRRPFPFLTELRINATIAIYPEETLYELLGKLSPTLRTIWLIGPPATRRSLPIRLPRLGNVTKFYMFRPWEFEEREQFTNFEEIFPALETLVFVNQTQPSFNYLMKGMRSTTVTSFCVCLTTSRPSQPQHGMEFYHPAGIFPEINRAAQEREARRGRYMRQQGLQVPLQAGLRGDGNLPMMQNLYRAPLPPGAPPALAGLAPHFIPPPHLRNPDVPVVPYYIHEAFARRAQEQIRVRDRMREMHMQRNELQHMGNMQNRNNRNYQMYYRGRGEPIQQPMPQRRPVEFEIPPVVNPLDANEGMNLEEWRARLLPGLGIQEGDARFQWRNYDDAMNEARQLPENRNHIVVPIPHREMRYVRLPQRVGPFDPRERLEQLRDLAAEEGLIGEGGEIQVHDMLRLNARLGNLGRPLPQQPQQNYPLAFIDDNQGNFNEQEDNNEGEEGGNQNQGEQNVQEEPQDENQNPMANANAAVAEGEFPGPNVNGPLVIEVPPVELPLPEDNRERNDGQVPEVPEADDENEIQVINEFPPARRCHHHHPFYGPNEDRMRLIWQAPACNLRNRNPLVIVSSDSESDDELRPEERRRRHEYIVPVVPEAADGNINANVNVAPGVGGAEHAAPLPVPGPAPNGNGLINPPAGPGAQAGNRPQQQVPIQIRRANREDGQEERDVRVIWRGHQMRNPMFPPALPERPVTMTRSKMQSINLAFPNLAKLTIQVCGPQTCGLKYIFEEMRSLQVLKILVENTLWNIRWDELFTGIPDDFCEAVKNNSEIWDDVYLTENPASIRNMNKLEELMVLETVKGDDRDQRQVHQHLEERPLSDLAYHFGFYKLKALKRLTVSQGFSPSQAMYRRWYDDKGYKIQVKPRTRLTLAFFAEQ